MAGALLDEELAVPGEIAQFTNRGGWHKAGTDEAVLEELGDPDGVVDVGLAAGDLGDLRGVGQDTSARLLQDVEHRPPGDPGALHGHVADASTRSIVTPPVESGASARRSVRVTILLGGLRGTKAGCRKLPRQFMCGLAVPIAPPTGPSAGAERVAHFHAAGWARGPWTLMLSTLTLLRSRSRVAPRADLVLQAIPVVHTLGSSSFALAVATGFYDGRSSSRIPRPLLKAARASATRRRNSG